MVEKYFDFVNLFDKVFKNLKAKKAIPQRIVTQIVTKAQYKNYYNLIKFLLNSKDEESKNLFLLNYLFLEKTGIEDILHEKNMGISNNIENLQTNSSKIFLILFLKKRFEYERKGRYEKRFT